ncbi:MAG TPA: ATP-binding protein [Candidatus Deferrimicrobium sp.]|nr:ATP-binding protein [Candidatus Deferrimicrobium sp.]
MRLKSVSLKLWLVMVTLVLLVLGSFSLALNLLFSDFYRNQKEASLKQEAIDISANLADVSNTLELQNELLKIRYTQGLNVFVVDTQGQVLATSGAMGMGMHGVNIEQNDFARILGGETVSIRGITMNNDTSLIIVATPWKLSNGKTLGAVLLSSPLAQVTESIKSFSHMLYYVVAVAVFLATLFALWLSRTLTTPLLEMNRIARRMSAGDFSDRVKVLTDDEIGNLGNSLNTLAEDLDKHIRLLSREKEQLGGILDSMGDAVVSLDSAGNVVQANPPALELWQGQPERKQQIQEKLREVLFQVNELGQPVQVDLELDTQILDVHMKQLKEVEGQDGGVVVMRDVTAGRRQEKLRRELMASASHELRTPIHLIQGQLEALADGLIPGPEQKDYLETTLTEVERLGRLICDLQEINNLEHGWEIVRHSLDLGELVSGVAERFTLRAQELGIKLLIDTQATHVLGDSDRLTQVFINLIENSLRYTPQGGTIKISMGVETSQALVTVSDTGKGIKPEHLPYIWESFFTADRTSKSNMGLGLAIVKRIVEAHGGKIAVDSQVGYGTCFRIYLPLQ